MAVLFVETSSGETAALGEDGELGFGWVVFNVPVGHSSGDCRVGSCSVGL